MSVTVWLLFSIELRSSGGIGESEPGLVEPLLVK